MIIMKVGEPIKGHPNGVGVGDYWFDPTTKLTQKLIYFHPAAILTNIGPAVIWHLILPSLRIPRTPIQGEVYIDATTDIPAMWDGFNWIPVVPPTYNFPPLNPNNGDMWIESMTGIPYLYSNGTWLKSSTVAVALPPAYLNGGGTWAPSVAAPPPQLQIFPSGVGMQNINLAPAAAAGANNIIITNTAPSMLLSASQNHNITINGPNNQMLVTIDTSTGQITYGPNYAPDAAAQIFWRAIAQSSPRFMQTRIDDLVADLKTVSSRLAVAEGSVLKFTQAGYKLPEPLKPFDPMESWDKAMGVIK